MPNVELHNSPPLRLTQALLFYTGNECAITRHPVADGVIQPGKPIDADTLREMLAKPDTGKAHNAEVPAWTWRDPRVLADCPQWVVWWTPPGLHPVFIAGLVRSAWLPGLVWCGHRSRPTLFLWAFAGKARPEPTTILYRPVLSTHIHADSAVCIGSMNPGRHTPDDWMSAFYDSNFQSAENLAAKPYAIAKKFKELGPLEKLLESCPMGAHS